MSVATDAIDRLQQRERMMRDRAIPGTVAWLAANDRLDALQEARGAVVDAEADAGLPC